MKWFQHVESNYGFHKSFSVDSFGVDFARVSSLRKSNSFSLSNNSNFARKPLKIDRETDNMNAIRSFEMQIEELKKQLTSGSAGNNRSKLTQRILELEVVVQSAMEMSEDPENVQLNNHNLLEDPHNSSTCSSQIAESTVSSAEDSPVNESSRADDGGGYGYISRATSVKKLNEVQAMKDTTRIHRIFDVLSNNGDITITNENKSSSTNGNYTFNENSFTVRDKSIEIDEWDHISYVVDSTITAFDTSNYDSIPPSNETTDTINFNNNSRLIENNSIKFSNESFAFSSCNTSPSNNHKSTFGSQPSNGDFDNKHCNEIASDSGGSEKSTDSIFNFLLLFNSFNEKSPAIFEGGTKYSSSCIFNLNESYNILFI